MISVTLLTIYNICNALNLTFVYAFSFIVVCFFVYLWLNQTKHLLKNETKKTEILHKRRDMPLLESCSQSGSCCSGFGTPVYYMITYSTKCNAICVCFYRIYLSETTPLIFTALLFRCSPQFLPTAHCVIIHKASPLPPQFLYSLWGLLTTGNLLWYFKQSRSV